MKLETSRNPPTGVLPFDMFRSFAPIVDMHWPVTWTPRCDIYETDSEIVLKMELPEMRKEDVRVSFENGALTLQGKRRFAETIGRENYHRIERHYGEFIRTFTVPKFVEGDKAIAEFKEGMLTVTLPKTLRRC